MERLAARKVRTDEIIGPDLARALCSLSREFKRQIGLLIHRSGKIEMILIGDFKGIMIPRLSTVRTSGGRLKGLRLVHTHLAGEDISDEDLMDLLFLRLDLLSVIKVDENGLPERLYSAHLLPGGGEKKSWGFLTPVHPANQEDSFIEFIQALESEFTRTNNSQLNSNQDRALLVSVSTESRIRGEESLAELRELAHSDDIEVLDSILQRRQKVNPRFILGKGKLADIMIRALQLNANLLIFNQELNPSQVRSITNYSEMRVIDRTQLILDIFAHRALSREGKLQVEMAQLKYMLPHLSTRDDALSRLTGGIGARGPGETKLEIDRRRINDRLAKLNKQLKQVSKERYRRRARRRKKNLPVLSLVGYTNAGKSTLLNSLTNSDIVAEDKLFATLDPTSRRLRFPHEMEVLITDTVGFIRNLPGELLQAFMATLEELQEADLLVHVIDISNPCYRDQVDVVEKLLAELELSSIPCLKVYNKIDKVDVLQLENLVFDRQGVLLSAVDTGTFQPFFERAEAMIGKSINDSGSLGCRL